MLLDTMVFLIGKHFALRRGKEHRSLTFSQFTLVEATTDEPEKLVYCSFGEKNNAGGLKHPRIRQQKIDLYANVEKSARCVVNLYGQRPILDFYFFYILIILMICLIYSLFSKHPIAPFLNCTTNIPRIPSIVLPDRKFEKAYQANFPLQH